MKRRRDLALLIVILMLGWAFWLQRMGVNDHDDAVSNELIFAREPVATIVSRIPWGDQSPLYFLALHVARNLGESPFAIQLLNALLLTLTLVSTYALGRALSPSPSAALAAVLLGAISPASLWLVRNGRMYSIQVLLSVVSLLCLLRYLERHRARDLVALALLSVLNVYNHFLGFLITALLFLPLVVDAGSDCLRRLRESGSSREAWRPLLPVGIAALGILVLVLPQVLRLAPLLDGGLPVRPGWSLPPLSRAFLERVSWFWFINSDWGSLRGAGRALTAVYLGSVVVLAAVGAAAARRRIAGIAGLWIVAPLLLLGLAASRLDVRDRHLVWALPLLWVAIASGAIGPRPSSRLARVGGDIALGVRAALLLAVAAGSLWLLSNKLPERYPQWTKLMLSLQQIHRPSMVVYMPPGPQTGTPRFLGSHLGLPAGLRDIRPLSGETRARFREEADQTKDFVFLVHWGRVNEELVWRSLYLEERGYRKGLLPVWGAQAQIFTRGEIEGFSRADRIETNPSPERAVAWVRRRLLERRRPPSNAPVLAEALVARVQDDGTIREGRLFTSQRGESRSWRLSPLERDAVEEVRTSSGGVERDVILAHPASGSTLVVAFPALEMKKALSLLHGIPDADLRSRSGAGVGLAVYLDGMKRVDAVAPNTPGWKELTLDTAALQGRATEVVLLLTTAGERARDFAFRLATSSRPAPARPVEPEEAISGPVILTGGRTLKDASGRLKVYRIAGARRLEASRDPRTYSASEMHEAEGPGGEGTLRGRWALGPALWDAVGLTRQRAGGDARDGLWAHPRNGTTLVIEAPRAATSGMLRGHFGLTDFSVARAAERGVAAPVRVKILVDGRSVLEREAPRERGWRAFAVPIPEGPGERSLRVEVASARDSWAHFVFDLWSD